MTPTEYIAKLREVISKAQGYMEHHYQCGVQVAEKCDCGYWDALNLTKQALALPVPEMTVDIEKGAIKIQTATLKIYSDDIAGVIDIDQCRKSAKAAAEAWELKGK